MLRATANKKNVYSLLGVLIRIDWFLFKEKYIISLRNILFYMNIILGHFFNKMLFFVIKRVNLEIPFEIISSASYYKFRFRK